MIEETYEMPKSILREMFVAGLEGGTLPTQEQFNIVNAMIILQKISIKNACKLIRILMLSK